MGTSVLSALITRHASGESLDAREIISELNLDDDNTAVRAWAISMKIATARQWEKAEADARRVRKIISALGAVPACAEEFVELYMQAIDARTDHGGEMSWLDAETGLRLETDIVEQTRKIILANDRLRAGFDREVLKAAAQQWFTDQRAARLPAIREGVAYRPDIEFDWESVARAAFEFETDEVTPAFVAAVLQKFIYSVKRKLAGLPVYNHLMPVLIGKQGSGKSMFVHALCRPMAEVTRETNFVRLTDAREIDLYKSYVLFLDEMAFASKGDIDVTKNVITSPKLDRRPLYTNSSISVRQNATLIGASNKTLAQLIRDETGNRRFCELNFRRVPDYDVINAADFTAAWRSIDERGADPIAPFAATLARLQESSRVRSTVEEWLESITEDEGRHIISEIGREVVRKEAVHQLYRRWREEQGAAARYTLEAQEFAAELHRLRKANPDGVPFEPARGPKNSFNGWRYVGPAAPSVRERLNLVRA